MDTSRIITLVVLLLLAIIPEVIASKKYYNAVGFYFYGVAAFVPALIHVLCLPDKSKGYDRRPSTSAVVLGGLSGALIFYILVYNKVVVALTGRVFFGGMYGVATMAFAMIAIAVDLWLLVCLYRCNRGKSIAANFIIRAIVAIIEPVITLTISCILFSSRDGSLSEYFASNLVTGFRRGTPSLIVAFATGLGFAILAIFIHRLNAGKSVMPKGLYCMAPAAIMVIATFVAQMVSLVNTHTVPLELGFSGVQVIVLALVGGYCWAASNIPSYKAPVEQPQEDTQAV